MSGHGELDRRLAAEREDRARAAEQAMLLRRDRAYQRATAEAAKEGRIPTVYEFALECCKEDIGRPAPFSDTSEDSPEPAPAGDGPYSRSSAAGSSWPQGHPGHLTDKEKHA